MTLDTGIYPAVASEVYHGAEVTDEPALSASIAKRILQQSPLHAWWHHSKLNPQFVPVASDKFDLGTVAHDLFLRGLDNTSVIVDAADWRSKAAQTARDAAREQGLIPILAKDSERVQTMVYAIRDQIAARDADPPLFDAGKPEQTIVWREPNGVLCKARLDWLHDSHRAIDDLKTVPSRGGTANPHDWSRTFWGIGADIEARFHSRGVKAITGREPQFRFVVAEGFAPFAISVLDLAPSAIALADRKIDRALAIWKDCLERDEWPAYDGIASIEADSWRQADFLERHWTPEDEELAA